MSSTLTKTGANLGNGQAAIDDEEGSKKRLAQTLCQPAHILALY
jgi:hypothetical protein